MQGLRIACLFLLISACSAELPPEFDIALANDEAVRNQAARQVVEDIRERFGSDAILSIGSRSPREYDFTNVVRDFADRAAVSYTNRAPDFVVIYELEAVDGYLRGPDVRNFVLTTSLVRTRSSNQGSEIVSTSSYRGRCREIEPRYLTSCNRQMYKFAEAALYSFRVS